jgi:RNA polymerase-interacting CarD/CdnL/TRCF family regulator
MNLSLTLRSNLKAGLMLTVGEIVVYPCQGPCLIKGITGRIGDNRPIMFYHLLLLDDGGGELFVPVDKALIIGVRPLMKKSDILCLLDHLKKPAQSADNYRVRARDNLERFISGSAFALAEIIRSLTDSGKSLSFGEIKTLEKARRLLICEIAEVMEETKEEAGERIDKALKNQGD